MDINGFDFLGEYKHIFATRIFNVISENPEFGLTWNMKRKSVASFFGI